jgi:hypothetical protein
MYTIHPDCEIIFEEKSFYLFKHAGLFAAVSRMCRTGVLNGYAAVPEGHFLYGKKYSDDIEVPDLEAVKFNGNYLGLLCTDAEKAKENVLHLDMAIDVHCGLTYSEDHLLNIENDLLGKLWWFGFDTNHSGDLAPIQSEIDRKYRLAHSDNTYKNFDFVLSQTQSLAEQLSKY